MREADKECPADGALKNKRRKAWGVRTYAEMQADPNDKHHGTLLGFKVGCKCARCWHAYDDYKKNGRKRKATTKEIVYNFMCSDKWDPHMSMSEIARAAGVSKSSCHSALHALEDEGRVVLGNRSDAKNGEIAAALVA